MATPNVNFFIHYVPCLEGEELESMKIKKFFDKRKFFSASKNYNFVEYVEHGSKEKLDYVEYSGNKEKSSGVFGFNGLLSLQEQNGLKERLRNTKSPIWYGLVSFEEMFGKTFCNKHEDAYALMKAEFPKFLKNAGFDKQNIEWFAGLHENTDNRHIHFSFYEKEQKHRRVNKAGLHYGLGPIDMYAVEKAKIDFELKLNDWNLKMKTVRNNLISESNNFLQNKQNIHGMIYKKIKEMVMFFPTTGRRSYDSENIKPLHEDIKQIVDLIIKKDAGTASVFNNFLYVLRQKDSIIKEVCEKSKIDYSNFLIYDKYYNDIYRRLGNQVIHTLFYIKSLNNKLEYEGKQNHIRKRIEKQNRKKIWDECLDLKVRVKDEAIKSFESFIHKLDEMNYKRLVEEGIIE